MGFCEVIPERYVVVVCLSTPLMGFECFDIEVSENNYFLSTPLMGFHGRRPPGEPGGGDDPAFNSLNGILAKRFWKGPGYYYHFQLP